MKKVTAADKLKMHFDEDWRANRSTLKQTIENRATYNPTTSWEGRSDNPIPNSRMDQAVEVAMQTTRPCTLLGKAVILLENPEGMTVYNVKGTEKTKSHIPLTLEQRELDMVENNLSATVPLVELAKKENKVILMENKGEYRNFQVHGPTFKLETPPDFLPPPGSEYNDKRLNPTQQKIAQDFNRKKALADRYVHEAMAHRLKTKEIMGGPLYHRGVLMVDSSDNKNSEIYGDKATQHELRRIQSSEALLRKRDFLASKSSAIATAGNILRPETLSSVVKEEPLWQGKSRAVHGGLDFNNTHDHLFVRNDKPVNPARTQYLRDQDLSGKNYNLISHTKIETLPSKIPYVENKTLAHPSQQSLHGTRNLQGALATRIYS